MSTASNGGGLYAERRFLIICALKIGYGFFAAVGRMCVDTVTQFGVVKYSYYYVSRIIRFFIALVPSHNNEVPLYLKWHEQVELTPLRTFMRRFW